MELTCSNEQMQENFQVHEMCIFCKSFSYTETLVSACCRGGVGFESGAHHAILEMSKIEPTASITGR